MFGMNSFPAGQLWIRLYVLGENNRRGHEFTQVKESLFHSIGEIFRIHKCIFLLLEMLYLNDKFW